MEEYKRAGNSFEIVLSSLHNSPVIILNERNQPHILHRLIHYTITNMKFFTITTALAVLATGAVARNCSPGLNYCGRTLLEIGKQCHINQTCDI